MVSRRIRGRLAAGALIAVGVYPAHQLASEPPGSQGVRPKPGPAADRPQLACPCRRRRRPRQPESRCWPRRRWCAQPGVGVQRRRLRGPAVIERPLLWDGEHAAGEGESGALTISVRGSWGRPPCGPVASLLTAFQTRAKLCAVSRPCPEWPSRPLRPGTWITSGLRPPADPSPNFLACGSGRPGIGATSAPRHPGAPVGQSTGGGHLLMGFCMSLGLVRLGRSRQPVSTGQTFPGRLSSWGRGCPGWSARRPGRLVGCRAR
jgi:hypothetical protein